MTTTNGVDVEQFEDYRSEFRENGFLVLPHVLSAEECERYIEVMDRLDRTVQRGARQRDRQPGDPLELRSCIKKEPTFMALVDRPDILALLGYLLGYNIQLGNSHAFIRPGFEQGTDGSRQILFGWHRDLMPTAAPVNGRYPHLATRVGYFFTSADRPMMGSLFVVPGSHRTAGRPAWDRTTDQPFGKFELLIGAGSAVLFDNRLWHSTSPNYSSVDRKNLYLEYCQRWMRPFDYHFQDEPVYAAASPVLKQLLGYDFTGIEDGYVGYQEPTADLDTPLRQWLAERGLTGIPAMRDDSY
jgi:ectoine hydroxylase